MCPCFGPTRQPAGVCREGGAPGTGSGPRRCRPGGGTGGERARDPPLQPQALVKKDMAWLQAAGLVSGSLLLDDGGADPSTAAAPTPGRGRAPSPLRRALEPDAPSGELGLTAKGKSADARWEGTSRPAVLPALPPAASWSAHWTLSPCTLKVRPGWLRTPSPTPRPTPKSPGRAAQTEAVEAQEAGDLCIRT